MVCLIPACSRKSCQVVKVIDPGNQNPSDQLHRLKEALALMVLKSDPHLQSISHVPYIVMRIKTPKPLYLPQVEMLSHLTVLACNPTSTSFPSS